jgi:hypothetical protein
MMHNQCGGILDPTRYGSLSQKNTFETIFAAFQASSPLAHQVPEPMEGLVSTENGVQLPTGGGGIDESVPIVDKVRRFEGAVVLVARMRPGWTTDFSLDMLAQR